MIDTNQIQQAAQDVAAVKNTVATNWPAICAGALWLRTELKNFSEYVIGHGGIGFMLLKLIWNPPAGQMQKNLTAAQTEKLSGQ